VTVGKGSGASQQKAYQNSWRANFKPEIFVTTRHSPILILEIDFAETRSDFNFQNSILKIGITSRSDFPTFPGNVKTETIDKKVKRKEKKMEKR
jgi:hypothetical protein